MFLCPLVDIVLTVARQEVEHRGVFFSVLRALSVCFTPGDTVGDARCLDTNGLQPDKDDLGR